MRPPPMREFKLSYTLKAKVRLVANEEEDVDIIEERGNDILNYACEQFNTSGYCAEITSFECDDLECGGVERG
jgi:hypothetical protein